MKPRLFIFAMLALSGGTVFTPLARAETVLTVHCYTEPNTFETINQAIIASHPGDTIKVCPGIYPENLFINRDGLKLISTEKGAAKLTPGNQQLPGFDIAADHVLVKGFAITGFGQGTRVVNPNGHVRIEDNIIYKNDIGVFFFNSSFNVVTENIISANVEEGVLDRNAGAVSSSAASGPSGNPANVYWRNIITYNGRTGLNVEFVVANNASVAPAIGERARIQLNRIDNNHDDGVRITLNANVQVVDNSLSFNGRAGIELIGAINNLITDNDADRNGASRTVCGPLKGPGACVGILLDTHSIGNVLKRNAARKNLVWDAKDLSSGSGTAKTGNTWDDNVCRNDSPDGLCER
jgi:parallel beta-helix repeat protein